MPFHSDLSALIAPLDPAAHAEEIKKLQSCRQIADLAHLASTDGGWLTARRTDPRLKLVRHGTGTYLVVRYDDGWSSTLSQAPFRTR